eukprot:s3176_g5.t1
MSSGSESPAAEPAVQELKEYRIYKEMILKPLSVESLQGLMEKSGSGRRALEAGLVMFMQELKNYVMGCDDRKFSRATMRRARGVESQLLSVAETILVVPWRARVLSADDLHGVWHGFVAMRGWRDCRVPQECLIRFLSGALAQLDESVAQEWKDHALNQELPLVQRSISVAAWPGLCQLLGQLPACVTAQELREALWKQAFVENPTRAPDHRNYKRFALLAAQMIAIGVELESDRAEMLIQQVLNLERPWRERRDMLSGILSAASVADRKKVVQNLDQRFEAHADLDDFEIVCGIAEHIGVEIPRDGAIRRCALRRWALDTKRGGALPVARLMDFVDCDAAIGQDVALSLRQRGRIADAAMLLSRLPIPDQGSGTVAGQVEMALGDVELERLQELLALGDDGAEGGQGEQVVFAPVDSSGFLLPFQGQAITSAEEALEACQRLRDTPVLSVQVFREEAPFWHCPASILAVCSDDSAELFDLTALRAESKPAETRDAAETKPVEKAPLTTFGFNLPAGAEVSIGWPDAAARLRALLSDRRRLKCIWGGEEEIVDIAYELGLGIASTLKPGDKEPLGPVLDTEALFKNLLDAEVQWPAVLRRFLGFRLCTEEEGSNWARRPLRHSQLHHSAVLTWTQLLLVRAICGHGLVTEPFLRSHVCVQCRPRLFGRSRGVGKHVLGQLAPAGRLAAENEIPVAQKPWLWKGPAVSTRSAPVSTRVVLLLGKEGEADEVVEMVGELAGNAAHVIPLGGPLEKQVRHIRPNQLRSLNSWDYPEWISRLPRGDACPEPVQPTPAQPHSEVLPAFATRLTPSNNASVARTVALPDRKQLLPAPDREERCLNLCRSLFDKEVAKKLLSSAADAQPRHLLGCYASVGEDSADAKQSFLIFGSWHLRTRHLWRWNRSSSHGVSNSVRAADSASGVPVEDVRRELPGKISDFEFCVRGCWAGGLVIDATESRVKVEYTLNGERCDKTLLRTSTNLRQDRFEDLLL